MEIEWVAVEECKKLAVVSVDVEERIAGSEAVATGVVDCKKEDWLGNKG
jgi:hypothetical protein